MNELTEVSNTLKTYLESVLTSVSKENTSEELISREENRLKDFSQRQSLESNPYIEHLVRGHKLKLDDIIVGLQENPTLLGFHDYLIKTSVRGNTFSCLLGEKAISEINKAREVLGLKTYVISKEDELRIKEVRRRSRRTSTMPSPESDETTEDEVPD